jgi:hypothetical protein
MTFTKMRLMNYLEEEAKLYRLTANDSLRRNVHLTEYPMTEREIIPQEVIDALLVDFINYIGTGQGLDEGFSIKYLKEN